MKNKLLGWTVPFLLSLSGAAYASSAGMPKHATVITSAAGPTMNLTLDPIDLDQFVPTERSCNSQLDLKLHYEGPRVLLTFGTEQYELIEKITDLTGHCFKTTSCNPKDVTTILRAYLRFRDLKSGVIMTAMVDFPEKTITLQVPPDTLGVGLITEWY